MRISSTQLTVVAALAVMASAASVVEEDLASRSLSEDIAGRSIDVDVEALVARSEVSVCSFSQKQVYLSCLSARREAL